MPSGTGKTVSLLSLVISYKAVRVTSAAQTTRRFPPFPSASNLLTPVCATIRPDAQFHPEMGKLIYCSRTVGEIEKALEELKRLIKYREKELGTPADFTAVGLTSRRNLCLHERVRARPAFCLFRPALPTHVQRGAVRCVCLSCWQVSKEKKGKAVDAGCRNLTASWVRQRAEQSPNDDIELCDYFEVGGSGLVCPLFVPCC